MLANNPYVIVIALDFRKTFDTVRYSTICTRWSNSTFLITCTNGSSTISADTRTVRRTAAPTLKPINASVIQGSAVGPASYAVTTSDLKATRDMNNLVKYADDTYIVIPASCSDTRSVEIDGVERWARANNLHLNSANSKEIFFVDTRRKRKAPEPSPLPGVARVT